MLQALRVAIATALIGIWGALVGGVMAGLRLVKLDNIIAGMADRRGHGCCSNRLQQQHKSQNGNG